jgi:hypothetical protein
VPTPPILTQNTLFYGDNLPILRSYNADASVDLVYLDLPPAHGTFKQAQRADAPAAEQGMFDL